MPLFDQRIATLIIKHLKGELSHEEAADLQQWLQSDENKQLFEDLTHESTLKEEVEKFNEGKNTTWNILNEKVQQDKVVPMSVRKRSFMPRIVAAAVVIFIIAGGAYIYNVSSNATPKEAIAEGPLALEDIQPGSSKAILTLSDGKSIILDQAQNGRLLLENGVEVIKLQDGQLLYQLIAATDKQPDPSVTYNTVSTPRGGQHKVLLSDGTQVWLNASSSISYPISFTSLKQRKVLITGEAYFEVASMKGKDKKKIPFIVDIAGKGEVEVLGTHFNINSYDDEETIKTTLLEGRVKVSNNGSKSAILTPGQQAVFAGHLSLTINNSPNIDQVMAWKNGRFIFKNATLETILKQAARWYDIDVVFEGDKPLERFSGPISMEYNLGDFFKILQYSDVKARLEENRRLIISH